ncbi:MAG: hypothetical protein B6A08_18450 [Sorangiineae bacterium NIC37A_2]|nr:MAG: hypothetical protein B6A08_18450 [Sorangiineae bacterium NIC37A_2]
MKPSSLLFRCDATPATGLGHFARCRDLARLLKKECPSLTMRFLGCFNSYAKEELDVLGFDRFDVEEDAPVVSPLLAELGSACVLDSYRLTASDYERAELKPLRIVAFDDFGVAAEARIALVLNARVAAQERFSYRAEAQALGTEFFLASPEILALRARARAIRESVRKVTVFIGGEDLYDRGAVLARSAREVCESAEVIWVGGRPIGGGVIAQPLGPSLADALEESDLVLAGGGRLKYEAGFCLLPVASISQTPLQAEDTRDLAERGLCVDLGAASSISAATLRAGLEALRGPEARQALRAAQVRAFPEHGPKRLVALVRRALGL